MAEHRPMLKNNQNTYHPHCGFTPKPGRAFPKTGVSFRCLVFTVKRRSAMSVWCCFRLVGRVSGASAAFAAAARMASLSDGDGEGGGGVRNRRPRRSPSSAPPRSPPTPSPPTAPRPLAPAAPVVARRCCCRRRTLCWSRSPPLLAPCSRRWRRPRR